MAFSGVTLQRSIRRRTPSGGELRSRSRLSALSPPRLPTHGGGRLSLLRNVCFGQIFACFNSSRYGMPESRRAMYRVVFRVSTWLGSHQYVPSCYVRTILFIMRGTTYLKPRRSYEHQHGPRCFELVRAGGGRIQLRSVGENVRILLTWAAPPGICCGSEFGRGSCCGLQSTVITFAPVIS